MADPLLGPTRRALLLGGASLPLWPTARAGTGAKNLIILLAWGGWDSVVSVDPKPGLSTVFSPDGDLSWFGELDILTADDRPAVGTFFDRWASRTALVRGIDVRSLAHVDCLRRLLTGGPDREAPDVGAILGATAGADLPVPYLLLGDRAFPGVLAGRSGRTGLTNQLADLLGDDGLYGLDAEVDGFLGRAADRVQDRLGPSLRLDDWRTARRHQPALRDHAALFGTSGAIPELTDQVALAVDALASGLSKVVMLDAGMDFDHHVQAIAQLPLHDALFAAADELVTALSDTPTATGSLLDDTVVWIASEMTRTPLLNSGNGKDHWPWATSVLVGGQVAGGRVFGGTDDGLLGLPVDLATGQHDPLGEPLGTAPFVRGMLQHLGVDPTPWLGEGETYGGPFSG